MMTRTIFSSLAILVLVGASAACDSDLDTDSSASATTAERTTTTTEIRTTTTKRSSSDNGGSGSTRVTLPGGITIPEELDIPDLSIPEDIKEDLNDAMGAVGDCATIVISTAALTGAALTGMDQIDFEEIRTDLKDLAPSDVDPSIDTLVDAFAELRESGADETEIMSRPEVEAASEAVTKWMDSACTG